MLSYETLPDGKLQANIFDGESWERIPLETMEDLDVLEWKRARELERKSDV